MQKFKLVKSKYLTLGVREDNINYAIESVNDGAKREHIMEVLGAGYRGMSEKQATQLLNEIYEANGGEFKKENNGGYLFGTVLCFVGVASVVALITMLVSGEWTLKFIVIALAGAAFGLGKGISLIIKSARGKYRDNDDPFNE